MGSERKVAVTTGASQGIGAALVKAFRDRDYRVVAMARSGWQSTDAGVFVIPGDGTDHETAERVISEGVKFGSSRSLACTYTNAEDGRVEHYTGDISKYAS
jgi:NAD(P)-dependent dehydrogenase (short-subunit alcohol dehydrogenase family)